LLTLAEELKLTKVRFELAKRDYASLPPDGRYVHGYGNLLTEAGCSVSSVERALSEGNVAAAHDYMKVACESVFRLENLVRYRMQERAGVM
jgi:hypothetical protein